MKGLILIAVSIVAFTLVEVLEHRAPHKIGPRRFLTGVAIATMALALHSTYVGLPD